MAALSSYLDKEFEKEAWRVYTADLLAAIVKSPLVGLEVVPFREFINPAPVDNRTADEILDEVAEAFT